MNQNVKLKELVFTYAVMKKFVADVTPAQLVKIDSILVDGLTFEQLTNHLKTIIKKDVSREKILELFNLFFNEIDTIKIAKLSISLLKHKNFIITEKNNRNSLEIVEDILKKRFTNLGDNCPSYKLTITYDNFTALKPYTDRVFSVWLLNTTSEEKLGLKNSDVLNNVLQIILDEAIMQSGRSSSGGDYESRIEELFRFYELEFTSHHHEEEDQSQEHDFLVKFNNKTIGIGAKRTLRERYKQYNPLEVDYSIVFTIGEDLNEPKTKTITETYNSYIFVADEIYEQSNFLKINKKVYKATSFSRDLLQQLTQATQ